MIKYTKEEEEEHAKRIERKNPNQCVYNEKPLNITKKTRKYIYALVHRIRHVAASRRCSM